MSGLAKICKKYGGMVTTDNDGKQTKWLYDYASDKAVHEDEMPFGSDRWRVSEKAKWASMIVRSFNK